jgi:hypothetical protein
MIFTVIGTGIALFFGISQATQSTISAIAEGRAQAQQPTAPQPIVIQLPAASQQEPAPSPSMPQQSPRQP